jgi:hypothetical protein
MGCNACVHLVLSCLCDFGLDSPDLSSQSGSLEFLLMFLLTSFVLSFFSCVAPSCQPALRIFLVSARI